MGFEAALVGGGLGLLGSSMAADAASSAAAQSAAAQTEAARIAAEEARFRPVGVTTAFGSSNFGYDENGRLNAAGYTLTPQMQAIRDQLLAQAQGQGLQTAQQGVQAGQGLFNLGQQYLATSPQQAAQQWMQAQQAVLQPSRDQQLASLNTNLFNSGRGGLAVAQGGALGAANPEMQAYQNAIAQQNLQLAAQAQEQGRAATQFGSGLLSGGLGLQSTAYSPFQTQLGLSSTVEDLGQNALNLGTAIGAKAQTGSSQAAQALLTGGLGAASTLQKANQYSPFGAALSGLAGNNQFTSGVGNWLGNLGNTGSSWATMDPNTYSGYGASSGDLGAWV